MLLVTAFIVSSLNMATYAGEPDHEPNFIIPLTKKADISIIGTVRDSIGGLSGVSVYVKENKNLRTVTDNQGRYTITTADNSTLVFVYVGFKTQELQVKNRRLIDVTLIPELSMLNETVVIGYGTQRKVNLTGAVDQISSEQLKNRPINNLGTGLQGLIPNLNISIPDGRPNGSAGFNIRGVTSINGGSPLILVDNIPFTEAEIARINPSDVESVTVLKDAASAAVYGGRASFGVVLISTKKAKSDKVSVNVNANTALRTIGKMPEVVTDPYTVMDLKNLAGIPLYNLYPESVRDYAKQRSANPSLPQVILNPTNTQNWAYYGNTDWKNEAYHTTAPTHTFNASISRHTDKLNYYFSSEYYRQEGMLRFGNDVFNRYNVRSKVDLNITNWLNFASNTMLTSSDYNQPVYVVANGDFFWNINRQNPLDVIYNPDGSYTSAGAGTLGRMKDGGRSVNRINEFQTTMSLDASLIKDLWTIKADGTVRRSSSKTDSFDIPIPYKTGPDNPILYTGSTTSYAQNRNDNTRYEVINIYSDIHKQLSDHYLQGLLGYNQEYRKADWFSARRNNLISNSLPSVQLATGTMTTNESIDDWAVKGVFYRLNYNYKNKYLLEFNGRYDGSSRFPKDDRWGFFPSASGGWLVSEESFFKPFKEVFNLFKLRGSYGSLGNQYVYDSAGNLLSYPYIATMPSSQIGQLLGATRPVTVNAPGAVAASLTWEKVSTINGGLDLALMNNRLELNADMYTRYTKDMLVPGRTLPSVFGTAAPRFNAADLKTKGWEIRLSWKDNGQLAGSPFFYNATLALSDSRSYITKYDNPTGILSDYYEGKELGEIWGLKSEGFFQNEQELATHATQTAVGSVNQNYKFYVGDIKFADANGDGKVDFGKNTLADHGDLSRVGNSSIRYPFSLDLSAGWKGFDLRVFLQGVAKRDWYPPAANIYFWGVYAQPWTNVTVANLDHWSPERPNAYFPAVRAYAAEQNNQALGIPNDRYMQDASYMRVKNITLGYSLPKKLSEKLRMSSVHFYVSGENLFEVSQLKVKLDPEGLNGNIYPFQRTYSFGLNVGF